MLQTFSDEQQKAVQFPSVEVDDIRLWSNPELYMNPGMAYFCCPAAMDADL
jgi:hypothetical protein